MHRTDWLIVESPSNWAVDRKNEFAHFGLPERFFYRREHFRAGDNLFTYVTGKSCFSDIREITKSGVRKLPMGGDYERSLPYCLDTKPVLVLEENRWLPVLDVKDKLKMTSQHSNWGLLFRSTPRKLDPSDAELLREFLTERNPK